MNNNLATGFFLFVDIWIKSCGHVCLHVKKSTTQTKSLYVESQTVISSPCHEIWPRPILNRITTWEREKKEGTTQSMLVGLFARISESCKSIPFPMMDRPLELNETLWKKDEEEKKLICVCYCSGSRHQRRHDNRDSSLGSSFRRKHSTRSPSTGEAGGTGASGSERRRERRQRRERKPLEQQSTTTTTTAATHRRSPHHVSPIQVGFPFLFSYWFSYFYLLSSSRFG